jgi:uncharacterized protein (TIGR00661 family)
MSKSDRIGSEFPVHAPRLRIAYAVHGYGRGHATRSMAMLGELAKRHEVRVLAGGDAYATMAGSLPVVRIPTLGFAYGRDTGARSNWATLRHNAGAVLDLCCRGALFEMVSAALREFGPDVLISDAEALSLRVAQRLGIPRIGFDHIGILAHCRPSIDPADRLEALFDAFVYSALMGRADRVLVSSFYPAPPRSSEVRVVPTLARRSVREATASDGEHLLLYLNQGHHQFDERLRRIFTELGRPVRVYGTPLRGRDGCLHFMPAGDASFVDDLASCQAVVSTAGNQLVGEAMLLGKPMLVMPERCVEQRMNARAVVELGIGLRVEPRAFGIGHLRELLARRTAFAARMRELHRDGLSDAVTTIEKFIAELVAVRPDIAGARRGVGVALLAGRRPAMP